jgi:hypothetical protein
MHKNDLLEGSKLLQIQREITRDNNSSSHIINLCFGSICVTTNATWATCGTLSDGIGFLDNPYTRYEVDAGPEEPRLEGYTGFYTDQGMEGPEYKKWEFGIYNYNSPIQYAYVINLDNGTLKLYCHCYLMRYFSFEELPGAQKDGWAHILLTCEDY